MTVDFPAFLSYNRNGKDLPAENSILPEMHGLLNTLRDADRRRNDLSVSDKQKKSKNARPESIYINRELSWLAFNRRVLLEAADLSVPLLERLKFLMIYQSNLEEFFRVRIGILSHRALLTPDTPDPLTGMLPETQIADVLRITQEQQVLLENIWKSIRAELLADRIDVLDFRKISKVDELMSKKLFGDIRDMLSPMIIEADQPIFGSLAR